MAQKKDLVDSILAEIKICDEFLLGASEASELAPDVQRRREELQARLEAIRNIPEDVLDEVGPQLQSHQLNEEHRLTESLPMMPKFQASAVRVQLGTAATSSDSDVLASIIRVDPGQSKWYPSYIRPLSKLANDRARVASVQAAYSRLSPALSDYINQALDTTTSATAGVASKDLACQHLRSAIQKIWGELCSRARSRAPAIAHSRLELRKASHRQRVASTIAPSVSSVGEIQQVFGSLAGLYGELSTPAKNPFEDDVQFLNEVTTRWKLHLYNLAELLAL